MSRAAAPYTLVLLRHGESEWNARNLFTGWVDVALTDKGRAEAARGGELMADAGYLPDVLHTSLMRRAIVTAQLALELSRRGRARATARRRGSAGLRADLALLEAQSLNDLGRSDEALVDAKEALRLAGSKLPVRTKVVKREADLFAG